MSCKLALQIGDIYLSVFLKEVWFKKNFSLVLFILFFLRIYIISQWLELCLTNAKSEMVPLLTPQCAT